MRSQSCDNIREAVELYQFLECSLHGDRHVLGISVAATKGDCFMRGPHYAGDTRVLACRETR